MKMTMKAVYFENPHVFTKQLNTFEKREVEE